VDHQFAGSAAVVRDERNAGRERLQACVRAALMLAQDECRVVGVESLRRLRFGSVEDDPPRRDRASGFEQRLAIRPVARFDGPQNVQLGIRNPRPQPRKAGDDLEQPHVARVNHPSLPAHPQHTLARQLFGERGFGGVLSFEIARADKNVVFRFMERLKLCLPATTLGDIYTLVLHPATSSHRSLSPEARAHIGINDGLIRLSAGIEEATDIIADLEQALAQA